MTEAIEIQRILSYRIEQTVELAGEELFVSGDVQAIADDMVANGAKQEQAYQDANLLLIMYQTYIAAKDYLKRNNETYQENIAVS